MTRRSAAVEKPPQRRHFHLAGVIWLINVGGAAIEEPTAAAATEQTPGKTVAIAEKSALSTDFPNGQRGTGRLTFRLRRLQRNAKHQDIYDSLRSVKGKALSRLGALSGKIVENCAICGQASAAPSEAVFDAATAWGQSRSQERWGY